MLAALVGFLACTLSAAPLRADGTADAERAYRGGNFDVAFRLWSELARDGDPNAAFSVGLMHDLGQGTPSDVAAAFDWYSRAAVAGVAAAEFNVAVMLDSGRGVPRDTLLASIWYGRAAARGNRRAQYNIAQLYADGDGVPQNADLARAWLHAAAAELPAAAAGLAAVALTARPRLAASATPESLIAPVLAAPPEGAYISPAGSGAAAELVWIGPPEPVGVRYFVEVLALTPDGPRDAVGQFTDVSALLVSLPRAGGDYAWRVYAVDKTSPHYVASAWRRLSVAGGS